LRPGELGLSRLPGPVPLRLLAYGLGLLTIWSSTVAGMLHYWRFQFSAHHPVALWSLATALAGFGLFALPLLGIVLVHELGHLWACFEARVRTVGPFFLPFPFYGATGTLGACLILLDPPPSRESSWQIASRGVIAGLTVALPIVVCGFLFSHPGHRAPAFVGDPLIMRLCGSTELVLHPLALAGRFGLWLTALNLLPVWPMDGWRMVKAAYGNGPGRLPYRHVKVAGMALLGLACWPF